MTFKTPVSEHSVTLKEKQSEFIALLNPIAAGEEFKAWLRSLRKEYHSASHICWAFRIMEHQKVLENSSDAGEPPGSAGLPIIYALKRSNVINAGLAIVRYFRGTQLGKRGLSLAYAKAAEKVIASGKLKPWIDWVQYGITCPLEYYGDLSSGLMKLGGKIISDNSTDHISWQTRIPRTKINELILLVRNVTQGQGDLDLVE